MAHPHLTANPKDGNNFNANAEEYCCAVSKLVVKCVFEFGEGELGKEVYSTDIKDGRDQTLEYYATVDGRVVVGDE